MTTVLIVEDEESLAEPLAFLLGKEGFTVLIAGDGPTALDEFANNDVDIVLLDLMLPGMSGTDVCRQLRKTSTVPVIMVTARDSEVDKVVGLELGADDYVTKPYSSRELIARIRAVLRRGGDADHEPEPNPSVLGAAACAWTSNATPSPSTAWTPPCPSKNTTCWNTCSATQGECSPAGNSSTTCGAKTTSVTPKPLTCTSNASAPKSKKNPNAPLTLSLCGAWATNSMLRRTSEGWLKERQTVLLGCLLLHVIVDIIEKILRYFEMPIPQLRRVFSPLRMIPSN